MKTARWLCSLTILALVGCSDDGGGPKPDVKTDGPVATNGEIDTTLDATRTDRPACSNCRTRPAARCSTSPTTRC